MTKYKTIIWDLDGTLLDTLQDLADATNYALRKHGMKEHSIDDIRMMVGNGVKKLIERAVPDGEQNAQFANVFSTFKNYYMEHCRDNTGLYPGIAETLKTLKAQGKRMAIVSNKLQVGVTELHRQYFADTIEVAIGEREGISRKPAPDMVEVALKELGVSKEDAVYIGDSDVDLATARNADLPCISVLWGFRNREFLIEHGATTMIEKPEEVIFNA